MSGYTHTEGSSYQSPTSGWRSALALTIGAGLLSRAGGVTLVQPIPDQIVDISKVYDKSLSAVFPPGYDYLRVTQSDGSALPSWLSLNYNLQASVNTGSSASGLAFQNSTNTLYVASTNSWQIYDTSASSFTLLSNSSVANGTVSGVAFCNTIPIVLVSAQSGGMLVYDVTNPRVPALINIYPAGTASERVQAGLCSADGNTFYVAMGTRGIDVLNATNKNNLNRIGNLPANGGSSRGLASSGNLLAAATFFGGTQLYNASVPTAPQLIANITSADGAWAVAMSGSILAVAAQLAGTQIVDISIPESPQVRSTIGAGASAVGVALLGNTLLTANSGGGMQILDVTTLSNPAALGVYPASGSSSVGVAFGNGKVFLANGIAGVLPVDLHQASLTGLPTDPIGKRYSLTVNARAYNGATLNSDNFRLTLDTPPSLGSASFSPQSLQADAKFVLPLNADFSFSRSAPGFMQLSLDLVNGQPAPAFFSLRLVPTLIKKLQAAAIGAGGAVSVDILGQDAFVGSGNLAEVDINVPSSMTLLSNTTNLGINRIKASASKPLIYAGSSSMLRVFNVSTSGSLVLVSSVPANASTTNYAIAESADVVFVANIPLGVQAISMSNSSAPVVINTNPVTTSTIAAIDTQLFTGSIAGGLQAWNYMAPSNPVLLASSNNGTGFIRNLHADSFGDRVFAMTNAELQIFDATTLQLRGSFSSISSAKSFGLTSVGNMVVIADNAKGTHFIDVTDEANPNSLAIYPSGNASSADVAVSGSNAFVASTTDGLVAIDLRQWQITADPKASDAGNYQLRLCGRDPFGGKACTSSTWRVEGPPQINGGFPLQTLWAGQLGTFFIPQGFVVDPNNDLVTFRLQANNMSWLTFNPYSATFFVTPPSNKVGNISVVVFANDGIFPEVNFMVTADVKTLPQVITVPVPDPLTQGRPFSWQLPSTSFSVAGLSYAASLAGGGPLPYGIVFNATTATFAGTLPQDAAEGTISIVVTASAGPGGEVAVPINFLVQPNFAPQVDPISNQNLGVLQDVSFYAPLSNFHDRNNDKLKVSAYFSSTWLNFDSQTLQFSGHTTRGDTNAFSPNQFNVKICAKDPGNAIGCTDFTVTVDGISNTNLALRYVLGLSGAFSLLVAGIKARAKCYNRKHRKVYGKDINVYAGEEFESQPLTTPAAGVIKIAIKKKGAASDDYTHHRLPAGKLLPHWLQYNEEKNTLCSVGKVPPHPEELDYDDSWVVVVKDKIGKIIEQHRLIRRKARVEASISLGVHENKTDFETSTNLAPRTGDLNKETRLRISRDTTTEERSSLSQGQGIELTTPAASS